MKPSTKTIASETARAKRDLVGLGVIAWFFGSFAIQVINGLLGGGTAGTIGVLLASLTALALIIRGRVRPLHDVASFTLNKSQRAINVGDVEEAERLLGEAEASPRFVWVKRQASVQRALIALRSGDLEEARRSLDVALALPLGLVSRDASRRTRSEARALRAFVRASLGDVVGARADIAAVRGDEGASYASHQALARVTLAEAVLLDRAGDRTRLKDLIHEHEELLLEHTSPRERALVRAMRRMVSVTEKGSIYRQRESPKRRRARGKDARLSDWVARIAPEAAPYVRDQGRAHTASKALYVEVARPSRKAVRKVRAARAASAQKKGSLWTAAALVGAPLALFFGAMGIVELQKSLSSASSSGGLSLAEVLAMGIGVAAPLVFMGLRLMRWQREPAVRKAAGEAWKRGGWVAADETRGAMLAESGSNEVAAGGYLTLASNAERKGDFEGAIAACDKGLGRIATAQKRGEVELLHADLVALRAFALAACDRRDEADAELALLGESYPGYGRAVFRVELVTLVRAHDFAGAARLAEQSTGDLPLSVREQLLGEVARAAAAPDRVGAGEVDRLREEIKASPERARWLDRVAPGLLEAFSHAGEVELPAARVRVAVPTGNVQQNQGIRSEMAADADNENAARAELEAEQEAEEADASEGERRAGRA
jgi:hypothetical protein